MIDFTTPIIPYVGTGIFKLNASYDEVKALLQENNISYKEEIWEATDVDPPWTVLVICKEGSNPQYSAVELFFAKNQLFKICLCEDFEGSLPNGIHTGMNFNDALKIDTNLEQDEDEGWDEVFISPDGYMVEYSNRNLDTISLSTNGKSLYKKIFPAELLGRDFLVTQP